jgi:hypothetical protein
MSVSVDTYIQIARNFYMEDRLNEAMRVIDDAFEQVGWPEGMWTEFYNRLVCEKDARDAATIHKVHDKLFIELDKDAPIYLYEDLKALALDAMRRVGELLNIQFKRPVMVTIFRPDAAVDFIAGSYGYVSHKTTLDKICFPQHVIDTHPGLIMRALMHEFTHVAVYELAGEDITSWLNEGLATYICGDLASREAKYLINLYAKSGRVPLTGQLESILINPKLRKDDPVQVQAAYFLSGSLIEWWADHYGLETIHDTLTRIGKGERQEKAVRHATKKPISDIECEWKKSLQEGIAYN